MKIDDTGSRYGPFMYLAEIDGRVYYGLYQLVPASLSVKVAEPFPEFAQVFRPNPLEVGRDYKCGQFRFRTVALTKYRKTIGVQMAKSHPYIHEPPELGYLLIAKNGLIERVEHQAEFIDRAWKERFRKLQKEADNGLIVVRDKIRPRYKFPEPYPSRFGYKFW